MNPGKPLQRRKPLVAKKGLERRTPLVARKPLETRTPLQTRKPLQARKALERKTAMVSRPKDRVKRAALTRLRPEPPPNREHMLRVKALPCLVCLHEGLVQKTPTEAHHIKRDPATGQVLGAHQKAPDEHTIPLCADHHREGGHGVAFHAGREPWEQSYGNELDLLAETHELLGLPPQGEAA